MPTQYTPRAKIPYGQRYDEDWDVPVAAAALRIDTVSAVGALCVAPREVPSAGLNVAVSAGTYPKSDGTVGSYAGAASYGVPASATTYLWLTDAGVLTQGSAFPATPHVRLGRVTTSATAVTGWWDERLSAGGTAGAPAGFLPAAGGQLTGALTVETTQTGAVPVLAADPAGMTVAFFGAPPAGQAAAVAALADATGGTAGGTVNDVGAAFSQATLDNNFATLAAKVNLLIAAMKRHGLMAGP